MRWIYANTFFMNGSATVDDLREAVTMLESVEISRKRFLGQAHPETARAQDALERARTKLAQARASKVVV